MLTRNFIGIIGLLLLAGCQAAPQNGNDSGGPPWGGGGPEGNDVMPAVEAVQAQYGSLPLEEQLHGVVRADNQVIIYPEIAAPVVEIYAENGDFVERGAPLVRLESRQFDEQLKQAEASLRISQADARQAEARLRELSAEVERNRQLGEKQFISELEMERQEAQLEQSEAALDRSRAQVEQAEATVEERRDAVRRTLVRAPIDGRIGQRHAEIGMRVGTSDPLFILGNFEKVRIEVSLTERMLSYITEGQRARITSENFPDTILVAEVARISPYLEQNSFSTVAELDVPNAGSLLKPGMFVDVDIFYGESEQATLVPTSALYEDPQTGMMGVFVATSLGMETDPIIDADTGNGELPPLTEPTPIAFKEVDIIAEGRMMSGISGVESGDWVVTIGQHLMYGNNVEARVRAMSWDRIIALQSLQREDVLLQFLEKQQELMRPATPPAEGMAPASSRSVSQRAG